MVMIITDSLYDVALNLLCPGYEYIEQIFHIRIVIEPSSFLIYKLVLVHELSRKLLHSL